VWVIIKERAVRQGRVKEESILSMIGAHGSQSSARIIVEGMSDSPWINVASRDISFQSSRGSNGVKRVKSFDVCAEEEGGKVRRFVEHHLGPCES
jgi:hypothetical protein